MLLSHFTRPYKLCLGTGSLTPEALTAAKIEDQGQLPSERYDRRLRLLGKIVGITSDPSFCYLGADIVLDCISRLYPASNVVGSKSHSNIEHELNSDNPTLPLDVVLVR